VPGRRRILIPNAIALKSASNAAPRLIAWKNDTATSRTPTDASAAEQITAAVTVAPMGYRQGLVDAVDKHALPMGHSSTVRVKR
jgi:hypothetical protein